MKTVKSVVVLTWLAFLFIPQVSSAPIGGVMIRIPNRFSNLAKVFKSGMKWYDRAKKADDLIEPLAAILPPSGSEEKAPTLDDINFYSIDFSVGNPPQQVTALFSISSVSTWASSYPSSSTTAACCTVITWANICCGTQCQSPPSCTSDSNGFTLVSDTFTFNSVDPFEGFIEVSKGGSSSSPIGVISFSNSPFSVVNNINSNKIFSYFLSFQSKKPSSITFGDSSSSTSGISSTPLRFNQYFPHLYFVRLSQISVGNGDTVNVESDLPYGVILDTIYPATLLAEPAYDKVKSAIVAQIGQPLGNTELDICYSSSPKWPNLTLSFINNNGDAARMILRKENYVVAIDAGLECVTILPTSSQGLSVIGSMAQLDRQMIFDVGNLMLYFDSSPDIELTSTTGSSDVNSADYAKPIDVSKLFAAYFILLLVCW